MPVAMSCLACCRRPRSHLSTKLRVLGCDSSSPHVLAFDVHQREARGIPQLVAEVAVTLATVQVEVQRAVERCERGEREAHGIRAERRDALRELLARARGDLLRLPRIHHVAGGLGHERFHVHAVDEVDGIDHVPLRLRHLVAFLVADDGIDVDVAERHVAGEVGRRHDHARDPEEDDVEAGDEDRRGQEGGELLRLVAASPAWSGTTAPRRTTCRARRHRA